MKRSRWEGDACAGLRGDYSGGAARGRSAPSACGEDLAGRGGYVIEQSPSGDSCGLKSEISWASTKLATAWVPTRLS